MCTRLCEAQGHRQSIRYTPTMKKLLIIFVVTLSLVSIGNGKTICILLIETIVKSIVQQGLSVTFALLAMSAGTKSVKQATQRCYPPSLVPLRWSTVSTVKLSGTQSVRHSWESYSTQRLKDELFLILDRWSRLGVPQLHRRAFVELERSTWPGRWQFNRLVRIMWHRSL